MTDMGDARAGGGGGNPLDVEPRAAIAGRLPARRSRIPRPTTSSGRSSRSKARASTRARSRAGTCRAASRRKRSGDGSWERPGEHHGVRRSSPCAPPGQGDVGQARRLASRRSELRRRLGLRSGPRSEPDSTGAAMQGLAAPGAARRRSTTGSPTCAQTQRATGAGRSTAASPTRNPRPGPSRAWSAAGVDPARRSRRRRARYLGRRQAGDGSYSYSQLVERRRRSG